MNPAGRVMPLTVLVHPGPMATAYLIALRQGGYRLQRIVVMVAESDVATGRAVAPWMPRGWRLAYAEKAQMLRVLHWPRTIRSRHPGLFQAVAAAITAELGFPESVCSAVAAEPDYHQYSDHVDRIMVRGFRDPALATCLANLAPTTVLFTGGGIVPRELLEIPGLRFLHVHPGHLPEVRGADGLLWSTIVRGRPGVSSFYMAPGIDLGDVVLTADMQPLVMPVRTPHRPDDQVLYASIYSFCDPFLRAAFLLKTLAQGQAPGHLPASPQSRAAGTTYHFMHPRLRARALAALFPPG